MNRILEFFESEFENLVKIEGRGDYFNLFGGSLFDMICENFIFKVQDVIFIIYDDSLFFEFLESVMYGKKVFSRELGFFQESLSINIEFRRDVDVILVSKDGNFQFGSYEVELVLGFFLMDSLEVGVVYMNIKNEKYLLMFFLKEGEFCCSEVGQRFESSGQLEVYCLVFRFLD